MTEWPIDARRQTLVLATAGGIPAVAATQPMAEDLSRLAAATRDDPTGDMIAALPDPSLTPDPVPPQPCGPNALKSGPLTPTGQFLMTLGLSLPVAWPATMWVVEGIRL